MCTIDLIFFSYTSRFGSFQGCRDTIEHIISDQEMICSTIELFNIAKSECPEIFFDFSICHEIR